jgi:hypothetical protein
VFQPPVIQFMKGTRFVLTQRILSGTNHSRGLDRIPLPISSWRKVNTFLTLSGNKGAGSFSQEQFLARWSSIQQRAARTKDLHEMTIGFWKMEGLGAAYGENPPRGCTLRDANVPLEVRPIVHTGMGVGAMQVGNFNPVHIMQRIEALAHPDFRLFAYESIGAMLGAYEMSIPKRLLGLKPMRRPQPEDFIRYFSPEIQRLISIGYGRILYFNSPSISAAFCKIADRHFLEASAAVLGVAFAYAMINYRDFWVVLETQGELLDPSLKASYRDGLIYALKFWEWEAPGFLLSLKPPSRRGADLIAVAQREINKCRGRGYLDAFLVEASTASSAASSSA